MRPLLVRQSLLPAPVGEFHLSGRRLLSIAPTRPVFFEYRESVVRRTGFVVRAPRLTGPDEAGLPANGGGIGKFAKRSGQLFLAIDLSLYFGAQDFVGGSPPRVGFLSLFRRCGPRRDAGQSQREHDLRKDHFSVHGFLPEPVQAMEKTSARLVTG
jgi:hypothetical protein